MKRKSLDMNENPPIISLEETKKIINDNLLRDKRKIKIRNPKRHVISEEKWAEGITWEDILQEGKEREKEMLMEVNTTQKLESDKALALLVSGTETLDPIVKPKPPPEGYTNKLVEPREGGELF